MYLKARAKVLLQIISLSDKKFNDTDCFQQNHDT
jgi:hypothetical protein